MWMTPFAFRDYDDDVEALSWGSPSIHHPRFAQSPGPAAISDCPQDEYTLSLCLWRVIRGLLHAQFISFRSEQRRGLKVESVLAVKGMRCWRGSRLSA